MDSLLLEIPSHAISLYTNSSRKLRKTLQVYGNRLPGNIISDIISTAIQKGKVSLLSVVLEFFPEYTEDTHLTVIENGCVKLYKALSEVCPFYDKELLLTAIRTSRNMTKLLYRPNILTNDDLSEAMIYASDTTISFLIKKGHSFEDLPIDDFMTYMEIGGPIYIEGISIEAIKRMIGYGYLNNEDFIDRVIRSCDMEKITIFHKAEYKFPSYSVVHTSEVEEYLHRYSLCQYSKCNDMCLDCRYYKQDVINDLWEMDDTTYTHNIQWLPREIIEGVICLLFDNY